MLFVVGRALAHGRRTALATACGHAAGSFAVAACVAVGLGTLLQRSAQAFVIVKVAGALYLIWLGRAAGNVPAQMLLLALVSVSIGAISDCAWGFAASAVRAWFARSPRRFELVGGAGGFAMIGVGVTVALTGRQT